MADGVVDGSDDDFWLLAAELRDVDEHRSQAAAIEAHGRAGRVFSDVLRAVAPGDVVTVVAADGAPLRGRILAVGRDFLTLGEIGDPTGTARSRLIRVHDLRLDAVVRLVREPEP